VINKIYLALSFLFVFISINMSKQDMSKNKNEMNSNLMIRIEKRKHDEFIEMCANNGYSMSKRIRLLMDRDLKEHKEK